MKMRSTRPMRIHQEPEVELAAIDRRIAWVLNHPGTSPWLKAALEAALAGDPLVVANDVEMLRHLLLPRSTAHALLVAEAAEPRNSM
ncbi:hypothetical protein ACNFJ7_01355 [Sphingomonas sp. HT-1]|uniref:hypothetical protein n=1 Tax=unclassified Sphingomonas TaxID=196159 RepID=UPI0002D38FE1|nr:MULTISPECIES: hypothetical protein [unclassified Sphingomonas]KTF69517.1 hypothetical protein ATB93_01060 [Sphingomonas sp. WG]